MLDKPSESEGKNDSGRHVNKSGVETISTRTVVSLSVSALMAIANSLIIFSYSIIFGWGWIRVLFGTWEEPEHWSWAGGLVGIFAVLLRLTVVAVFFLPYAFMLTVGLISALVSFNKNRRQPLAAILILVHSLLAISLFAILLSFFFF